jgi:dihydrofolate reductase
MINAIPSNRLALWWNTTPEKALLRAKKSFGENILVEGGPELVTYLADRGLIDGLELSVTQATGGDEKFDYQALLAKFSNVAQEVVAETIFYSATL